MDWCDVSNQHHKSEQEILSCRQLIFDRDKKSNAPLFSKKDIVFNAGSQYWLVGENWAGKSTLLKLIIWQLQPLWWDIFYKWMPITTLSTQKRIQLWIWYVSQHGSLFHNCSVYENILAGCILNKEFDQWAFFEQNHIQEILLTTGLYAQLHLSVSSCSFGQQRIIELLRIFAMNKDVILLDEPTAWLHGSTRDALMVIFAHWHLQEKTLIVIEHNQATLSSLLPQHQHIHL